MNFKTTLSLLVVLAAVGIYLLIARPSSTTAPSKPAEAKKVLDIKPDQVTAFSIAPADGKPTSFVKQGADWEMTEPLKSSTDNSQVDSLLRDILGTESKDQIDASQKTSNGLDHPAYTISITTGDKTQKLLVGDKPPVGNTLGVMVDGQDKIQVADVSLVSKLDKKPSTYRKTRLVDASTDQIRQVEITRGKNTIRLEKKGNDWQIVAPAKMPADSSAVESILFAITGLNANGYDDTDTAADAGLTKPRATVWFSAAAPATQPTTSPTSQPAGKTIKFGGYEDVTNKNLFVSVDDGPIAKVPTSTYESFKKTPLDLRDKTVVSIDPDHVESFSLAIDRPAATQPAGGSTGGSPAPESPATYSLERRKAEKALGPALPTTGPASQPATALATQPASKWMFTGGDAADDALVKTFLDAFHPLKAEKFDETSAAATQPAATYTIRFKSGPSAGNAGGEQSIKIVDPGKDQKLIGTFESLTFELDRALAATLDAGFKAKK